MEAIMFELDLVGYSMNLQLHCELGIAKIQYFEEEKRKCILSGCLPCIQTWHVPLAINFYINYKNTKIIFFVRSCTM